MTSMLTVSSGDVVHKRSTGLGRTVPNGPYVTVGKDGRIYVWEMVAHQWAEALGGALPDYVTLAVPEPGTLVLLPADGPGLASYRLTPANAGGTACRVYARGALSKAGITHDHTRAVPASVEAVQGPEGITPAVVVRAGDR